MAAAGAVRRRAVASRLWFRPRGLPAVGAIAAEVPAPGPGRRPRAVLVDAIARWVSRLLSPPAYGLVGAAVLAGAGPAARAWLVGYVALAVAVPLAYVFSLVMRGHAADFDLSVRGERTRPYLATLLGMTVAVAAMGAVGAPRLYVSLGAAGAVQTAALLLVTLRWKISAHAATAAAVGTLAQTLSAPGSHLLVAAIPVVCWSRVRLGRHDWAQTLAGAAVGGGAMLAVLGAVL